MSEDRRQGDAERSASQGWDIPESMRATPPPAEQASPLEQQRQPQSGPKRRAAVPPQAFDPYPPWQSMRVRVADLSPWVEIQRGCWLAAGATIFFLVAIPLVLLILSVLGFSLLGVLAGLIS